MEHRWGETQPVVFVSGGSGEANSGHLGASDTGGQTFSGIRNADHSRSHYGNVYNNVCQSHGQYSADSKVRDLEKALAFEGMERRHMSIGPACADTCTWFLQTPEYIKWRDPTHRFLHNGVLWIKGKAGTGKSTLMRHIHEYARKHLDAHTVAAFFFDGRSVDTLARSTVGMYRSLLHQLCSQVPRLQTAAAHNFYLDKQHIWTIEMLEDLLRSFVLGLSVDEKVTCHIDALDECETSEVRSAIEFFENLSQSATSEGLQFSVCFSSRYYPQITMQNHVEVRLDAMSEHSQDITTYLNKKFTIRSPSRDYLQAEIERRCSGIFLWVVLVVKVLKEDSDRGATRSQLREKLLAVPEQLDALFAKIAESAGESFHVAMRWVLFSKEALTTVELYFAIMTGTGRLNSAFWDTDEVDMDTIRTYILHVSRGLIECQGVSSEEFSPSDLEHVRFIHESVGEHLLSQGNANLECIPQPDFEADSNARMAADCQTYLQLCSESKDILLKRRKYVTGRGIFKNLNSIPDYPLCSYAWNSIMKHVKSACGGDSVDFGPLSQLDIRDYIALGSDFDWFPGYSFVPGHPAAYLMLLIQYQCYDLAKTILMEVIPSRHDEDLSDRHETSRASIPLTSMDLTTLCGGDYGSPIHEAVACRRKDLVKLLLEKGADVDLAGDTSPRWCPQRYESPLFMAIGLEDRRMVRLLVDHGARLDLFSHGFNALHKACMTLDTEMVALFLSQGVNVDLPSHAGGNNRRYPDGSCALHIAVRPILPWRDSEPVLLALLDAGANVNAIDKDGNTALTLACENNSLAAVKILLDHGAKLEHRNSENKSAREVARKWTPTMIEDLLLPKGASLYKDGALPLLGGAYEWPPSLQPLLQK
jgi:ankyrin repeat protein